MNGFWQIVASNAMVATMLAIGVTLIGRVWKNPHGRHLLWVLVLVKLLAPPIVTIPVVFTTADTPAVETTALRDEGSAPGRASESPAGDGRAPLAQTGTPPSAPRHAAFTLSRGGLHAMSWLSEVSWLDLAACAWGAGSVALAIYYGLIIVRFRRLLGFAEPARPMLVEMAATIGRKLGLRRTPEIVTLDVRLSPLVFAIGGRPRIVLPVQLCEQLDTDALRSILVHEMAHLRRRDHLVRLLELVATTLFWWHPIVWWASRQLHDLAEECCDGIVLDAVPSGSKTYANAILDTLDFIAQRPVAATLGPTMVRRSSSLARRIQMLQTRSPGGPLKHGHLLWMAALVAFPLAVAVGASDPLTGESTADGAVDGAAVDGAAVDGAAVDGAAVDGAAVAETAGAEKPAAAGEKDETVTFKDPLRDDDGPGTYTYPTDPAYKRGSFDLTEFSVTKKGERVKFDVTVAAPLADPWKLRSGFSVQMVFIFIQTDDRRDAGFTDTVPGLNVTFAPTHAWNKLVILSPQPAARIEGEIQEKVPPAERSSIIVPDRAKGADHTISATVDLAQLGGGDPSKWGYQVVMQSNEGFPEGFDLLTRRVNATAEMHRFGGGTDSDSDPQVMDLLAGKAEGAAEEVEAQHEMLRQERNPDGTTKRGAMLKMLRK